MDITPSTPAAPQEIWHRPFVREHRQWCDDFVLELRLRDVPGPVIGERLAEVEAHCAETGESPSEAFGDPTGYARQLEEPSAPEQESDAWGTALTSAGQALALIVGTAAVGPWARGEQLSYNAVQLAALAVFTVTLLCLPVLIGQVVRWPWVVGTPVVAIATLAAGGSTIAGRLDLPAVVTLPPAAVTVGLFVLTLVLAVPKHRDLSRAVAASRIPSPLASAPHEPVRDRSRWLPLGLSYLIPAAYVALAALGWFAA